MSRVLVLAVTMAITASSGPLSAQSSGAPYVMTSGNGRLSLPPSSAMISLEISTRASTATQAATDNSRKAQSVLTAFRQLGPVVDSVRVVSVNASPNEDYDKGKLIDYEASTSILATVADLNRLGQVLETALRAGANHIGRTEFRADSMNVARQKALAAAFRAAEADARTLAEASHQHLGRLLVISTALGSPISGAVALNEVNVTTGEFGNSYAQVSPTPTGVIVEARVTAKWELLSGESVSKREHR